MKQLNRFLKSLIPDKHTSWINKYTAVIIVFCIWIGFLDRYSLVNQFKLSQRLRKLETARIDYERQLEEAKKERDIINSNIEKFAREKYLFHKENEEVILIK